MKGMFKHALACALMGFVAASAQAQGRLTVEDDLVAGTTTTISYVNPGKAGKKVTVTVRPVGGVYPPVDLEVQLDAAGRGSVDWLVLAWLGATFNVEGEAEETRAILDLLDPLEPLL